MVSVLTVHRVTNYMDLKFCPSFKLPKRYEREVSLPTSLLIGGLSRSAGDIFAGLVLLPYFETYEVKQVVLNINILDLSLLFERGKAICTSSGHPTSQRQVQTSSRGK